MIPIRCLSCGKPVSAHFDEYNRRLADGEKSKDILDDLTLKTSTINEDIVDNKNKLKGLKGSDYNKLNVDDKNFLGSIVNNILSLSTLIGKTIE